MYATVNGYDRDHGPKEIFDCDIVSDARVQATSSPPEIHISLPVSLTLNGKYWFHLVITEKEINRLFYLTHREILREVVVMFEKFKQEEDEEAEARARREAEKAKSTIRRR